MKKPRKGVGDPSWPEHDVAMLHIVTYCSRASESVDAAALGHIVSTAQQYNACRGITGILVFSEGIFLQWLEGPRDAIIPLMKRIAKDPRHDGLVMLNELEEVRGRMFPNWSMELVHITEICQVLSRTLELANDAAIIQAVRLLLADLSTGGLAELTLH
jgi:hypothetical protein